LSSVFDSLLSWSRRHTLCPLFFGVCCGAPEHISGLDRRLDPPARSGELGSVSPRHADLLVVGGRISLKLAPLLLHTYNEMQSPRWVVAVGACAISGGAFHTYAGTRGIGELIPVDVHIAGCPPEPRALSGALSLLQTSIASARHIRAGH